METYESNVHKLHGSQANAYAKLADLRNLELLKSSMPQDKVKNFVCDQDSCSFSIDPMGSVTLRIVEREPAKTIKFGADNLPIAFNAWIQLKENSLGETLLKITLKADLPFMIKTMLGGKLQNGVEQIADVIAKVL